MYWFGISFGLLDFYFWLITVKSALENYVFPLINSPDTRNPSVNFSNHFTPLSPDDTDNDNELVSVVSGLIMNCPTHPGETLNFVQVI